uniref:Uncharacterized protein n=1 Tax=Panagrolaimus sp. ES5 TaxID=591445 RepID=A0AC34F5W7_9BILA
MPWNMLNQLIQLLVDQVLSGTDEAKGEGQIGTTGIPDSRGIQLQPSSFQNPDIATCLGALFINKNSETTNHPGIDEDENVIAKKQDVTHFVANSNQYSNVASFEKKAPEIRFVDANNRKSKSAQGATEVQDVVPSERTSFKTTTPYSFGHRLISSHAINNHSEELSSVRHEKPHMNEINSDRIGTFIVPPLEYVLPTFIPQPLQSLPAKVVPQPLQGLPAAIVPQPLQGLPAAVIPSNVTQVRIPASYHVTADTSLTMEEIEEKLKKEEIKAQYLKLKRDNIVLEKGVKNISKK